MELKEYQESAKRFININLTSMGISSHALFGLCSEVGELHGLFQKELQGHKIDEIHAKKELGDVLWFVAEVATAFGWDLNEIAEMNIEKLEARYPNGFEVEKSLHRKEGDI